MNNSAAVSFQLQFDHHRWFGQQFKSLWNIHLTSEKQNQSPQGINHSTSDLSTHSPHVSAQLCFQVSTFTGTKSMLQILQTKGLKWNQWQMRKKGSFELCSISYILNLFKAGQWIVTHEGSKCGLPTLAQVTIFQIPTLEQFD